MFLFVMHWITSLILVASQDELNLSANVRAAVQKHSALSCWSSVASQYASSGVSCTVLLVICCFSIRKFWSLWWTPLRAFQHWCLPEELSTTLRSQQLQENQPHAFLNNSTVRDQLQNKNTWISFWRPCDYREWPPRNLTSCTFRAESCTWLSCQH